MKKLNPATKLKLQGLLGMLLVSPFAWVLFAYGPTRDLPAKWRAIALILLGAVSYAFFLQKRTPDKTALKPKWWR